MVNTLPLHVTENEIRSDILVYGLVPKDIRLIRRKDTGRVERCDTSLFLTTLWCMYVCLCVRVCV